MDSVPPQPLDSLAIPNRKEAFEKLGSLCFHRANYPTCSEEELADGAGFTSAETMRISLENWGLSALLPAEEGKPQKTVGKPPRKPRTPREPTPSKEVGRKLPALANATGLIRDRINTLTAYLERLPYHQVILRDGRLVATDEIPKDAELYPIVYLRSEHSPEQWQEICAEHDEDPESTVQLHVYQDTSLAKGASHYPPWFETCLLTTVLMQSPGAVERLLKEVCLEPAGVPREKIYALLYGRPGKNDGLYPAARKLARLIRTGEVREGGRPNATIRPFQQASVQAIKEGREKGLTDERLRQMLELSEEEFKKLENLL